MTWEDYLNTGFMVLRDIKESYSLYVLKKAAAKLEAMINELPEFLDAYQRHMDDLETVIKIVEGNQ